MENVTRKVLLMSLIIWLAPLEKSLLDFKREFDKKSELCFSLFRKTLSFDKKHVLKVRIFKIFLLFKTLLRKTESRDLWWSSWLLPIFSSFINGVCFALLCSIHNFDRDFCCCCQLTSSDDLALVQILLFNYNRGLYTHQFEAIQFI